MLQLATLPPHKVANFWQYYEAACSGAIPDVKLTKPADQYNDIGSRYSIEHLQYIGCNILYLPLELMATYACKQVAEGEQIAIYNMNAAKALPLMNATSIGNLAHTALHSPNAKMQQYAITLLQELTALYDATIE